MKNILLLTVLTFSAVQISAQIIPHVELDYISTVSGKKYSGVIVKNDDDTVTIKISSRNVNIAKSQIDTLGKMEFILPFLKGKPYGEIIVSEGTKQKKLYGNILEFDFGNSIVFKENKSGKTHSFNWNQFSNLKTMDPDYFYFDIIKPALSDYIKGEFNEVLDTDRFIFTGQDGKKAEYYFSRVDDIYVRHPEKFNIPKKFSDTPREQAKLKTFISIGGGLLIPSEISGGNSNSQNDFSNYGFHAYVDFNFPVSQFAYWGASGAFQSIPSAEKAKNGYSVKADNWMNIWLLTGPMLAFQGEETMGYLTVQGGILIPGFPTQNITYKPTNYSEEIRGESDNQIAFAFGGGFNFGKILLSAKYFTSSADFTLMSNRTTSTGKLETDISSLVFCLGIKLGK